ncbi:MAG TPA: hypothetical protein VEA16_15065 [Vicinamibacterales bacterium]|nr:hypothetical protein [Vicinamibacterales bacterium]
MTTFTRSLLSLATIALFATPALAGPPLICHPFQTDGGKLIAWGTGPGWNTPDRSYDVKRLVGDTTAVLTADAPTLTRMENIRRATIYAMRDPEVANQLLKAVIARALATSTDGAAWFDAGYLIESYKQATHMRENGNPQLRAWAAVDETIKVDGYNWVKKAMAMTGANAEMEFAASLMTRGSIAAAHRAKAVASAAKGSLLAKNLATSAEFF